MTVNTIIIALEILGMANWYLGTMGFSWKDWSGTFYPEGLDANEYLAYYSRIFNAVEIDSTFYGTPRNEYVQRWADITPEGFKICAKMPKIITHEMELKGTAELVNQFLDTIRLLGDKLAVILIQFPPSFTISHLPVLDVFLDRLPHDLRFAVEVRHRSWHRPETEEMLRKHQVAWAATEYEHLPKRIYLTSNYLYVRFIGHHRRFRNHRSEKVNVTPQLEWWYENLEPFMDQVDSVYGFFNNDYSGFAPGSCNRFRALAGQPVMPFTPPQQGRLF